MLLENRCVMKVGVFGEIVCQNFRIGIVGRRDVIHLADPSDRTDCVKTQSEPFNPSTSLRAGRAQSLTKGRTVKYLRLLLHNPFVLRLLEAWTGFHTVSRNERRRSMSSIP
jgi:hypothetical protein